MLGHHIVVIAYACPLLHALQPHHDSGAMAAPQQPGRRWRRPLPNETLVPVGFEAVSHPCFMHLRREIPLEDADDGKRRRAEFGAPWEASDEAIGGGKQPEKPEGQPLQSSPVQQQIGTKKGKRGRDDEGEEDADDLLECCICQEDTMRDPVTCCVQGCYHSYCRECIRRWLAISQACPLCKQAVIWLLGFSSSTNSSTSGSSLRYSLIAVGPDQAELERQPFPAPTLLQAARAKQLRIHKGMERRRRGQERGGATEAEQQGESAKEKGKEREKRSKRRKERRRGDACGSSAGAGVKGKSAAAILEGELARLDREIERESRKLERGNKQSVDVDSSVV